MTKPLTRSIVSTTLSQTGNMIVHTYGEVTVDSRVDGEIVVTVKDPSYCEFRTDAEGGDDD